MNIRKCDNDCITGKSKSSLLCKHMNAFKCENNQTIRRAVEIIYRLNIFTGLPFHQEEHSCLPGFGIITGFKHDCVECRL